MTTIFITTTPSPPSSSYYCYKDYMAMATSHMREIRNVYKILVEKCEGKDHLKT
jgi:hypothetical protein